VTQPERITSDTRTAEDIARDYTSSLDSVTLINDTIATGNLDEEKKATIKRNTDHLEIILAREGWTNEDLAPLPKAVTAGKAVIY
jgi:hypothetical protein